ALAVMALACLPVVLFWPGLMNNDALEMYVEARGGGAVSDWHSPLLVWAWRGLLRLGLDVAAFTVLQGAVFVGSLVWLLRRTSLG
ncbi:hypothetical protein NL526_28920, partial [Klebsiella pneumoniae]|nr:hypothetical protein [Klebsiella pneumoniae]